MDQSLLLKEYSKFIKTVKKFKRNLADNVREIILGFIKKKGLVIYGGYAIHLLTNYGYYKKGDPIDYDVYSPNYMDDSLELGQLLKANGVKRIRIVNAINDGTRKIFIGLMRESIIDFSFKPMSELKDIIHDKQIDGFTVAKPDYIKIDQYKNLHANLFTDYNRITKSLKKITFLENTFPTTLTNVSRKLESDPDKIKELMVLLEKNIDIVVGGEYIMNYYLNNKFEGEPIIYYNGILDKDSKIRRERYDNEMFYDLVQIGEKQCKIATRLTIIYQNYLDGTNLDQVGNLLEGIGANYYNVQIDHDNILPIQKGTPSPTIFI